MLKILQVMTLLIFFAGYSGAATFQLKTQAVSAEGFSINLNVPENMRVEYVASLSQPRFITLGPDNELLIGSKVGTIYRLKLPYQTVEPLVTLSGYFHSTAYNNGTLYAAETSGVWAASYSGATTTLTPKDFHKVVQLPSATGGHSSRTIVKGPDGRMYIGLGISGNCSDEYLSSSYPFERRRGGVFALDANAVLHPYASGLRNPIGLAFHPVTGDLYATNAGSDNMGYDRPPEVLAKLSQNSFHGMPWFQYYDGSFGDGLCADSTPPRPASDAQVPAALFAARSTPQGITFLEKTSLGNKAEGSAVVAVHGSWATQPGKGIESRRPPKLALVVFTNNTARQVEDLVTGFQRANGSRFARPSGVIIGGDGNLYFTSDGGDVAGLFRLVPSTTSLSSLMGVLLRKN